MFCMSLIEVKNLDKTYYSGEIETPAVKGVSFNINKGEFVAIMGPSGSGKSTLMHILGLLDKATSGEYFFDDQNAKYLNDNELAFLRNEKMGFVFQAFNLLPRTTVLDNVKLPLTYSKKEFDHNEKAKKALADVELSNRLDYYTNEISGGEKQRVAIARALVNDPSIIFADEPTGNLDSKTGKQIINILQKLNETGNTIILVTHDKEIAKHANRIIHLKDGLIISDEPVE